MEAIFHRPDNGEPFADCAKCEALNRWCGEALGSLRSLPRYHLARLLANWFRQPRWLPFFGSTLARLSR